MDKSEIYCQLDMTYAELVNYLFQKYGAVQHDYFTNEKCTSKSKKISRTSEGLFCHHIDEDKCASLSDKVSAIKYPFDYQRAKRLVYCNYLEHLILHMRIGIETYWIQHTELSEPSQIPYLINSGFGVLAQEINTLYDEMGSTVGWKQRCFEEIKDNYEDYISILKHFFMYVDKKYIRGKRNYSVGQIVNHPQFGQGTIIEIINKPIEMLLIKFGNDEKKIVSLFLEKSLYEQMIYRIKENMSRTSRGTIIHTMISLL